jgi:hypothetical protein
MLLFPWTHQFSLGAWVYTVQTGRLNDAAAYYSGLGWVWTSAGSCSRLLAGGC